MLTTPEIITLINSKIKQAQKDKDECIDLKNYEGARYFIDILITYNELLIEIQC